NSMEIIEATRDAIDFKAVATITNVSKFSNIEIDIGSNVEFDLISVQNITIAKITIEDFQINYENKSTIVRLKYIESYLNGRDNLLSIKATNMTTSISLLQKAFETIKLEVVIPGLGVPLINEMEVAFTSKDSFNLHNPLKTRLHLFGFNAKVFNEFNEQIATATKRPSDIGIVVEPGQTEKIQVESSNIDIKNAIKNIKDCVKGVKENLECVLMFGIGENNLYRIDLNYLPKEEISYRLNFYHQFSMHGIPIFLGTGSLCLYLILSILL
ncbi:12916_t:CDS:2, partial [Racocetra persica]